MGVVYSPPDDQRYAVCVRDGAIDVDLATTSRDGIGLTLVTLFDEGQITAQDRVGIRDLQRQVWVVSPYSLGRPKGTRP